MKRVLVTGGAGFVGSHLCDRFIQEGTSVVALDNFITGSEDNLRTLSKEKRFTLVRKDISRTNTLTGPLDAVLHFASPASPPDYLKYPLETLLVGSLGTHNALEIARAKKAAFLMASTSEVYGDPEVSPQGEKYHGNVNPSGPRSVYDEAKRYSEAVTMAYHRLYRMDTKIVRIFNTYGPRMRPEDGRVIPNFISQALMGRPLTVYGNGSQTRSYCHVSDLVDGIVRLLKSRQHEPVNLGNPNEMTVLELARLLLKMTGSKSRIVYRELPEDDPKRRCPDIRLAKKVLGWTPKVDLRSGLADTLEYFRGILPAKK
jgi:dTDP-glucose 4,6-dehydratase